MKKTGFEAFSVWSDSFRPSAALVRFIEQEVNGEWERAHCYHGETGDGWETLEVSFEREHEKYYPMVVAEAARIGGIILKTDVHTYNTVVFFRR